VAANDAAGVPVHLRRTHSTTAMSESDPTSLLYIADPMCSWCYGFAPSIAALHARYPGTPLVVAMGGLRPHGEPLDQRLHDMLLHHWNEVARRSGQPFDRGALARDGWVYTTEPACRAVVTARTLDAARALDMLHAVQRAFYAAGRDTTDDEVLADVAAAVGLDRVAFATAFASPAMTEATQQDFAITQRLGVRGFPTLIALRGGAGEVLAAGWQAPAELLERASRLLGD
jgi:putative protein-disulfide isomerase